MRIEFLQLEVGLLATAISYHQHRDLLGRHSPSFGTSTALTRRSGQLALALEGLQEESFIRFDNVRGVLGLVIGNPRKKPVLPQESRVLTDAAMDCGLAYAQALDQRLCIVLPKMAFSQSRHGGARQGITGFAANLAAVSRQVTTGAPWTQLSGLTIWAVAWGFDCILREPASQRKPRYQVIVLL